MNTLIAFTPSATAVFSFLATLDGQDYQCTCPWNYGGQRYYLTVKANDGTLIYNLPLIESAPNQTPINLNAGYFTTPLSFSGANQQFVIG